jgi:hypothetical protein
MSLLAESTFEILDPVGVCAPEAHEPALRRPFAPAYLGSFYTDHWRYPQLYPIVPAYEAGPEPATVEERDRNSMPREVGEFRAYIFAVLFAAAGSCYLLWGLAEIA